MVLCIYSRDFGCKDTANIFIRHSNYTYKNLIAHQTIAYGLFLLKTYKTFLK